MIQVWPEVVLPSTQHNQKKWSFIGQGNKGKTEQPEQRPEHP